MDPILFVPGGDAGKYSRLTKDVLGPRVAEGWGI